MELMNNAFVPGINGRLVELGLLRLLPASIKALPHLFLNPYS
jgi:hypothetical protein